jgi:secondary thiamine-phosphate synthase enzyme
MCRIYHEVINISTSKRFELIDVTYKVEEVVKRSGIRNGICIVFAPHATAAIIANEHEPGLMDDLITFIKEFTQVSRDWKHNIIDDNAHAHIGSALISTHRLFPVINGRLVRGTWQNIFLVEMDGPRPSRTVYVVIMGE